MAKEASMNKESSSMIDDPEFALRYWPVRDAILALSAHYKRRHGAVDQAILVMVPENDQRAVVQLLDGFDVRVVTAIDLEFREMLEATVIVGGGNFEQEILGRRTRGPVLLFP
jgi:hypothetical protein